MVATQGLDIQKKNKQAIQAFKHIAQELELEITEDEIGNFSWS